MIGERRPTRRARTARRGNCDRPPLRRDATTTSCSSAASRRPTRRCWRSSPARPSVKNLLKVAAPPYLYSGPSPVASLATVLAGFDVNEQRGDALRADLYAQDRRACSTASTASASTRPNRSGLPDHRDPARATTSGIGAVGRFLFERGIYVTLAAYPLVPEGRGRLPRSSSPPPTPTPRSTADRRPRASSPSRYELQPHGSSDPRMAA